MAKATAASAAAITITNIPNTCPSRFIPPNLENAIKLTLAAFRISSTPINTAIPFRRVITPNTPSENKIAATNR
ncbi:uncharacterized protein METZ01_LOCUS46442 [marine metagenome]|uniref:Uncharacterized protein n=1 Tax=marine metagenome TaxID=408172 RepID=A0A381RRH5_9ZZZZ